jgi:hypothetical protein
MASDQSNLSNPPFQTPQPKELHSKEAKEVTRQRLVEFQEAESHAIDDRTLKDNVAAPEGVDDVEKTNDDFDNLPLPSVNSPPD